MKHVLAAFISIGSVATALFEGARFGPQRPRTGAWYLALEKPSFTPSGPVIGSAWTVLGGLQAYAGFRLLAAAPSQSRDVAVGSWALTVLGIAGYQWSFFGRKKLTASTGIAALMVASAATTALSSRKVDARAAAAAWPVLAWISFALLLSEEITRRNER